MNTKLFSTDRHSSIPENKDPFGNFIGAWSLDLTITNPNGSTLKYKGEWHFHRILQGRAIQDIWIIPGLTAQGDNAFHEYGTTIRTFNPKTNKWKAVWIGPIQNQFFVFDIEDHIDQITLTATNTPIDMKWSFYNISPNSFKWKSEVKAKENWFINYFMELTRI
ncbi:MAG TPA: hypothetical protein PKM16_09455 [Bacteroidia bacterium]|nr:hypothetical protein [Bacteroidia bacterium]HNS11895.1 hypothetical protein [Bacteroidia bacterium]